MLTCTGGCMQSAFSATRNQKMKMERKNTRKNKTQKLYVRSESVGLLQCYWETPAVQRYPGMLIRYLDCCVNKAVRFVLHRAELVFADRGLTTTRQCVVACDRWKQTDSLDVYRLTVVDVINSSSTYYSFAAKDSSRPVAVVMTSTAVTDGNWLRWCIAAPLDKFYYLQNNIFVIQWLLPIAMLYISAVFGVERSVCLSAFPSQFSIVSACTDLFACFDYTVWSVTWTTVCWSR